MMDETKYPNLRQMWGLFGAFLLINLAVGVVQIITLFIIKSPDEVLKSTKTVYDNWLNLAVYITVMGLTVLWAKKRSFSVDFDYGFVLNKVPDLLFLLLIVLVPVLIVVEDFIVGLIPMPEKFEEIFAQLITPNLPSFLTIVIAAPILEELLCRGIVLRGLLKNMPPYQAIVWSAVFFAVLHLNPWQGIVAFSTGCIAGWIFWKTQSVIPCIFIHLLNNGICFLLTLAVGDSTITLQDMLGNSYVIVLLLSALATAAVLFLIYRYLNKLEIR